MTYLRRAQNLARLVLVLFVLSLGTAMASPLVNPKATQLICTGTGVMKVISITDDGAQEVSSQSMDCPLCASLAAPPPVLRFSAEPVSPLSYALQSAPAAIMALRTAAPLPARGPPKL
ncbi:MAG: DUF2946 family protein [Burkholderiaceae bacterium]